MAKRVNNDSVKPNRMPPAVTLEGRENQLIAKATDEAEKRIESGKASDSLIIHYLRLGTTKMQLEKEKLEAEVELAKAKSDSIARDDETKKLYQEAIQAFKVYTGQSEEDDYED